MVGMVKIRRPRRKEPPLHASEAAKAFLAVCSLALHHLAAHETVIVQTDSAPSLGPPLTSESGQTWSPGPVPGPDPDQEAVHSLALAQEDPFVSKPGLRGNSVVSLSYWGQKAGKVKQRKKALKVSRLNEPQFGPEDDGLEDRGQVGPPPLPSPDVAQPSRSKSDPEGDESGPERSSTKKAAAIILILCCCVLVAIVINFINLRSDYEDLLDFYTGYMGRRMHIIEGMLTTKAHQAKLRAEERVRQLLGPSDQIQTDNQDFTGISTSSRIKKAESIPIANGSVQSGAFEIDVMESSFSDENKTLISPGYLGCKGEGAPLPGLPNTSKVRPQGRIESSGASSGRARMTSTIGSPSTTTTTTLVVRKASGTSSSMNCFDTLPKKNATNHCEGDRGQSMAGGGSFARSPPDGAGARPGLQADTVHLDDSPASLLTGPTHVARLAFDEVNRFGPVESIFHVAPPVLVLCCKRYMEDQDPMWRNLDYSADIGLPPESFFEFVCQYDWNIWYLNHNSGSDSLSAREVEKRKNLYHQFRKWKRRKQKMFNIVVTERAKKEMADQEGGLGKR